MKINYFLQRVRKGLVQASWVLMSLLFSKTYEKNFHLGVFTLIDEVNDGLLTAEELIKGNMTRCLSL